MGRVFLTKCYERRKVRKMQSLS